METLENNSIIAKKEEIKEEKENINPVLYETVYKKGAMKGELRFYHTGGINSAVEKVKAYLTKKHLKHLHTMPFVIDLENDNLEEQMKMMT